MLKRNESIKRWIVTSIEGFEGFGSWKRNELIVGDSDFLRSN
jgi:hypothetical protein